MANGDDPDAGFAPPSPTIAARSISATTPPSNTKAQSRLDQLSHQISPTDSSTSTPPPRPGPKRINRRSAPLPADWSDVLSELDLVRKLGETPNVNSTGYKRHKEAGKLWVRERIELLCDPGDIQGGRRVSWNGDMEVSRCQERC